MEVAKRKWAKLVSSQLRQEAKKRKLRADQLIVPDLSSGESSDTDAKKDSSDTDAKKDSSGSEDPGEEVSKAMG